MGDFQIGDEIMAPWTNDGFLYPAILVAIDGEKGHVAYLDGDEADVWLAALRHGALGPGMQVNVNWKGQRRYYDGVIRQRIGQAVFVDYADGDRGWATVAQCRVRAEVVQVIQPQLMACSYCGSPMDVGAPACPTCGGPRHGRA